LLLLECVDVNIYNILKCFISFVHYMYMYKMCNVYIYVFLFCIHVVVGVDDFFVHCNFSSVTSRSGLLSVVRPHAHACRPVGAETCCEQRE
jgi:hypothetical protein